MIPIIQKTVIKFRERVCVEWRFPETEKGGNISRPMLIPDLQVQILFLKQNYEAEEIYHLANLRTCL